MDDHALPQQSPPDLPAQARRLLVERFPDALGAVLGGSAARGRARAASDLDLAVLLPDTDTTRRELIRHEGRLAELFLHTLGDVPDVLEAEREQRRGTMLFIYGEGLVLDDPHGHLARVRARSRALLEAGPPALTSAQWERSRYVATCFLDDLLDTARDERHEQLATADFLLREASLLLTAHHGAWTGIGRWLPRRLLAADPDLGAALLDGHLALAERADPQPLAAAAEKVLELVGGPLREGYVQVR
ncbi:nucleotidyltransferase domain-containing protein [Streptomyces sp. VRA16 Mangrove soil]|uniref:nucleotidyltransferase domain-containing protein n=1 Tax=Streptomyces sp. VRA16 Mangrove soil TaxID=2817434 RepID=UPI001A9D1EF2|nr:nucleotidyltransferase domain-containing protein [Streptomyces sp. VRA16 Mangrove soil]MBO1334971.1 nucleotidyltransferase domain-containing protein [Streptomyces sp. VRA16 Mangrove soil]